MSRHSPRNDDLRCGCGSLMARLRDGYIELKCRRCKQVHVLRVIGAEGPDAGEIACCGHGATVTVVNDN
jgi:phage FluMu protein Com